MPKTTEKEKFDPKEKAQIWYEAAEDFMLDERPQDALNCFRRAANLGHVQAMFEVGETYGADGNLVECLLWTRRAAAFGHEGAIAELQEDGNYVEDWQDDFVVRVKAGDYQIEDGIIYTADGNTKTKPAASTAPRVTCAAAAAPSRSVPIPLPAVSTDCDYTELAADDNASKAQKLTTQREEEENNKGCCSIM